MHGSFWYLDFVWIALCSNAAARRNGGKSPIQAKQTAQCMTDTKIPDKRVFNDTKPPAPDHSSRFWRLVLGSIGVVYGDIGTSPLYALREALAHASQDGLINSEVIGVVSLLLWTLMLLVTFKYVILILQADNNGEGGNLSLLALAQKAIGRRGFLLGIGVVGASLFYGDAIITPAISVLSAVEGLKLVTPALAPGYCRLPVRS